MTRNSFTINDGANYAPTAEAEKVVGPGEFIFAAAYLDHGHIYGQTNGLRDAGGTLAYVYDTEPARVAAFLKRYPEAKAVDNFQQILDDPHVHLVTAAAIPCRRASIGFQVLESGKDYFTDKSPFTSLEQLREARYRVQQTSRKYMVYYSERLHNDAAWMAGELIEAGAIGRVLQVVNLAPHRLDKSSRPDWFFDKCQYGGIITDIGSHQVEQFLTYSGARDALINYARACNFDNPDTPGLEDFGELSLTGDNGSSFYARVDWFTPQGARSWGDGRTFIVGSKGSIEIRKYMDIAREAPASKLFLIDQKGEREIDCFAKTGFPFFGRLILDVLNRSEEAMSQEVAFKAAEISLMAQRLAELGNGANQAW